MNGSKDLKPDGANVSVVDDGINLATAQTKTIKAIFQDEYGAPEGVFELREIDKPTVGDGEVLVRVHAAPVSGTDWHLYRGLPYAARFVTGLRKPKNRVPGLELAGRWRRSAKM